MPGVGGGRCRMMVSSLLDEGASVIFITAKFRIKPEDADRWPEISREFTQACRAEPGCKWFDWARSVDDPNEYVLTEAFRDDAAGAAHRNWKCVPAGIERQVPGASGTVSCRSP